MSKPADAACSCCGSQIAHGHGFAMYSEATEAISADHRVFFDAADLPSEEDGNVREGPLGASPSGECTNATCPGRFLLYCEECANALFTKKVWEDAKPVKVELQPDDVDPGKCNEARTAVINVGVTLRQKRLGITPSQAFWEARQFGKLWWKDQDAAKRKILAQDNLNGLGGWLVLVGLNLLYEPFLLIPSSQHLRLVYHLLLFFNSNILLRFVYYNPWARNLPVLALLMLGPGCLCFLYFRKKRLFPAYYIGYMLLRTIFCVVGLGGGALILVANSALWTSYLLRSWRVKATFVR